MKVRQLIATAAVVALTLVGTAISTGSASAHRDHHARHIHAVAVLGPVPGGNFLTNVTTSQSLRYGDVVLEAASDVDGQPYTVDLFASLAYTNGSGPFDGTITFTAPGGDSLAFDYHGAATLNGDGSTTVAGSLNVFSGTGQFAKTTGVGTVSGSRVAGLPVGSPVTYVIDADIHDGKPAMPKVLAHADEVEHARSGFTVDLMGIPAERFVTTNPDGRSYGFLRLTGASKFDGVDVTVVDQVSIAYANGSGPFNAFITLNAADGSQLVMAYKGGTKASRSGGAAVNGLLNVIAATGRWAGKSGTGVMTGTRSGAVGAPLQATAKITLK